MRKTDSGMSRVQYILKEASLSFLQVGQVPTGNLLWGATGLGATGLGLALP